jgi:hypothetical protein
MTADFDLFLYSSLRESRGKLAGSQVALPNERRVSGSSTFEQALKPPRSGENSNDLSAAVLIVFDSRLLYLNMFV